MSCYSQSERDAAFAAPWKFSFRAVLSRVADHFHRARDRRRQRQELIDYLASDHRAARDLGITIYDVDNFCRQSGKLKPRGVETSNDYDD